MAENQYKKYPKPEDFEPEPYFPEDHKRAGKARCTAWAKSKGEQCANSPADEKTSKCRFHGGRALRGPENGNWKNGRYEGKYAATHPSPHTAAIVKTRWRAAYVKYLDSTDNLSLGEDVALNLARISKQIESINESVTPDFIEEVELYITSIKEAVVNKDIEDLARNVIAIEKLLTQAKRGLYGEKKLDSLISQRIALVEKQAKLIEKSERHMPVQTVASLLLRVFNLVSDSIERHVDPQVYRLIMNEARLTISDSMIYLGTLDAEKQIDGEVMNGS